MTYLSYAQDRPGHVSSCFLGDYKYFKTAILSDIEISGDRYTEKISTLECSEEREETAEKLEICRLENKYLRERLKGQTY